jgi:hypothetical protein
MEYFPGSSVGIPACRLYTSNLTHSQLGYRRSHGPNHRSCSSRQREMALDLLDQPALQRFHLPRPRNFRQTDACRTGNHFL